MAFYDELYRQGGARTSDFRDSNQNGRDDRDEPYSGPGKGVLDPSRFPVAPVPGYQAPGDAQAPQQTQTPFSFNRDSVLNILSNYAHTPEGLKQAFAENEGLRGVSQIGGNKGDKILDPTTGRLIDVIQAAGEGGKAWQWLDDQGGGKDLIQPSMFMGSPFASGMPTDTGFFEQLMRQARAQAGLDRGQSDRDALLSLLGG